MYNYPIGKSVPPPPGGGQGGPPQPGGGGWTAPTGSWAPPGGAWAPPSGSWAPPTNTWGGGGGGGYPPQPNPGGYPSPSGGYQPQPSPGGFPPQPSPGGGYPPQPSSGGFPTPGGYAPQPSPGGYPPQPGGWGYPAAPSPGGYPAAPNPGGYPAAPSPGGYPPQPSPGGYVPQPSPGGYPATPSAPQIPVPIVPTVIPSVKPAVTDNFKGVSPSDYDSSIQFFREMASKENMPDEGKNAFLRLAGEDGEIDAFELQDILNKVFLKDFQFDGFSTDMTRSMVAMRDFDMSGKLGYDDFKKLWADLALCKKAFIALDQNNSGAFCRTEFQRAISTMGLTITPKAQQALIMRYSDKEGNVRFDDFVAAYIKLKTMMKTFRGKDTTNKGISEFEKDEYVQLAMYA